MSCCCCPGRVMRKRWQTFRLRGLKKVSEKGVDGWEEGQSTIVALCPQVLSPYRVGYRGGIGALVLQHRCWHCSSSMESTERSDEAVSGVKEHCGTLQLWLVVFYYSSSAYYSVVGRVLWSVVTSTVEAPGSFRLGPITSVPATPTGTVQWLLLPPLLPQGKFLHGTDLSRRNTIIPNAWHQILIPLGFPWDLPCDTPPPKRSSLHNQILCLPMVVWGFSAHRREKWTTMLLWVPSSNYSQI